MSETISIPWKGWQIVKKLGSGSFGTVYEIHREAYGVSEKAAMKVIPVPQDMDALYDMGGSELDSASIESWCQKKISTITQEYAVMIDLKDEPNIVRCDDMEVVRKEDGEGYNIFIRMELLEPLHKVIRNGNLSEHEVIRLAWDICNAISVCEDHGIIHRDIKPENILVNSKGNYKLGDFGAARELDHTTAATRTGTPPYMAPEMALGKEYGRTVDIYALGILMYRLLNNNKLPFWPTNQLPDPDEIAEAFTRRISGEQIKEPLNGSPELKSIVLKACAYEPADRYQSAKEMLDDIRNLPKERRIYREDDAASDDLTIAETGTKASGDNMTEIPGTDEDDATVAMFGTSGKQIAEPDPDKNAVLDDSDKTATLDSQDKTATLYEPAEVKTAVDTSEETSHKKRLPAVALLLLIVGVAAFAFLARPSDKKVSVAFERYIDKQVTQSSYRDSDEHPVIENVEHTFNRTNTATSSDMTLLSYSIDDFDGDGQLEMILSRSYSADTHPDYTLTLFEYSWGKVSESKECNAGLFHFDDGVPSGDFYPTGVAIYNDKLENTCVLPFSDRYNELYSGLPEGAYVWYDKAPADSDDISYIRHLGYGHHSIEYLTAEDYQVEMSKLETSEDGQLTEPLDVVFTHIQ